MSDSDSTNERYLPSNPNLGVVVHRPGDSPPPGAIRLTPTEALHIQWARIKCWKPQEDVWPLRHGLKLLSLATFVSGYITTLHTRRYFQLTTQRFFTTMVPTTFLPGMMGVIAYQTFLHSQIVAGHVKCNLCAETSGAVFQLTTGLGVPFLMSMASCMAVAKLDRTYPVPAPSDWRQVLKVTQLAASSSRTVLTMLAVGQFVLGGWMAGKMIETQRYILHRDAFIAETAEPVATDNEMAYRIKR